MLASTNAMVNDLMPVAVTTVDGPLLVIAAAGSGKTRVLTRRVGHLVLQGIDTLQQYALNRLVSERKSVKKT